MRAANKLWKRAARETLSGQNRLVRPLVEARTKNSDAGMARTYVDRNGFQVVDDRAEKQARQKEKARKIRLKDIALPTSATSSASAYVKPTARPTPQKAVGECPLCGRNGDLTRHHLVPRARGGGKTVKVCLVCHVGLHQQFTLDELATERNTLPALKMAFLTPRSLDNGNMASNIGVPD